MAENKDKDTANKSAPAPAATPFEVGQVLTAEGLAALRAEMEAKIRSEVKVDPTFSDPNPATSLDVGLHATLMADIRQDLKGAPVPKGAVAMFCATDQRVVTESGHVFLFPKNTVQHVPAAFVSICRKAGCAEVAVEK